MRTRHTRSLGLTLLLVASVASSPGAHAQCSSWSPGWAAPAQPSAGPMFGLASFRDGVESHLFASRQPSTSLHEVRRWNGQLWELSFISTAVNFTFDGLFAAEEVGAPLLIAPLRNLSLSGSPFTVVWTFDGNTWSQRGTAGFRVYTAGSYDDGTGSGLYLAGHGSGINPPGVVARWNGTSWDQYPQLVRRITNLATFDDGSGPQLYAGGIGPEISGNPIVRWNGSAWEAAGAAPSDYCFKLATFQGSLYAALNGLATANTLQRFAGGIWTVVPTPSSDVTHIEVVDFGSGPVLALAGSMGVYFYDGATFTQPGGALIGQARWVGMTTAGGAPKLYAQGELSTPAGERLCHDPAGLAVTDGVSWTTLGHGLDAQVSSLTRHDFGSGEELAALGDFAIAGLGTGTFAGLAAWNGTRWRALPTPANHDLFVLAEIDLGAGPELYLGGSWVMDQPYRGVARWSFSNWGSFAADIGGDVHALTAYDSPTGRKLVAGGQFLQPGGGGNIAILNGTTWGPLGTGTNSIVAALATYSESTGTNLIAGGAFTSAGGVGTGTVARWNGSAWSALGSSVVGGVTSLCVFDAGSGAALYAGGSLTNAGGVPVQNIARWNGTSWSNLPGGGTNGAVLALAVHDDGRGPALYVGGGFSSIGGITAYDLARFDGTTWEAVDGGLDNAVRAFASVDDDSDGDQELFAGGSFENTAVFSTGYVARLAGCPRYQAFCFGDGTLTDHTTPCPCGNNGAPGHGCASSFVAAGALLTASGNVNPDTLLLSASDEPASSFTLFMQHDALDERVFHDGVLCGGGTLIRLRGRNAVAGQASFPDPMWDSTITVSQRGLVVPGSGATRYYSAFYRNASTTFCPPATANGTNGMRVIW